MQNCFIQLITVVRVFCTCTPTRGEATPTVLFSTDKPLHYHVCGYSTNRLTLLLQPSGKKILQCLLLQKKSLVKNNKLHNITKKTSTPSNRVNVLKLINFVSHNLDTKWDSRILSLGDVTVIKPAVKKKRKETLNGDKFLLYFFYLQVSKNSVKYTIWHYLKVKLKPNHVLVAWLYKI